MDLALMRKHNPCSYKGPTHVGLELSFIAEDMSKVIILLWSTSTNTWLLYCRPDDSTHTQLSAHPIYTHTPTHLVAAPLCMGCTPWETGWETSVVAQRTGEEGEASLLVDRELVRGKGSLWTQQQPGNDVKITIYKHYTKHQTLIWYTAPDSTNAQCCHSYTRVDYSLLILHWVPYWGLGLIYNSYNTSRGIWLIHKHSPLGRFTPSWVVLINQPNPDWRCYNWFITRFKV